MLEIIKIGENTKHDRSFFVDRPNGHPVYLLILVKTPAKFFVNKNWQRTPAGIAVIFKAGQQHLYGPTDDSPEFPAYTDNWMHIAKPVSVLSEHFPFGTPIVLHNPEHYYSLFHLIHTEFYGASSHKNIVLDHLTTALLHKIEDESQTKKYPEIYYLIASLREEIYRSPQTEWNIPDMAASLNISEGYLHSVYKHFFNTTCISDVINSRIQAASELLISTNKSIEEIAECCGYHNTEHFIRQFKEKIKLTPAKYRKMDFSEVKKLNV